MKTTLLFALFTCLFLASCSTAKVAKVSSDKVPSTKNGFVFENDTVRITYHFWNWMGSMTYDIYNKLDVPIYLDWKTSAFIPNDRMMSYWHDVVNTEGVYIASGYLAERKSVGKVKSKSIHQERIGVVPPHSMITNSQYRLVPTESYLSGWGSVKTYYSYPNGNGKMSVMQANYSIQNSPLVFRNYLAISTNEKFEGRVAFVDNKFYISSVATLPAKKVYLLKSALSFYVYKDVIL